MASANEVDIVALKTQLYDRLLEEQDDNPGIVWHQHEILELGIVKDLTILLGVAQLLINEKLFKAVQEQGELGWVLRTPLEARQYRSLTTEQEIVYSIIDEGGSDGAWTKTIKARSNLHEAVYKAAIKHLEAKSMIQEMKSVEHPTRKMYIKSSVRQSDKSTGGSWFTNGELDEAFIQAIAEVLHRYVKGKTFYRSSSASGGGGGPSSPKLAKKTIVGSAHGKKLTPEEAKALRNKALDSTQEVVLSDFEKRQMGFQRNLPMPAGYDGYPDVSELTLFMENSPVTDQTLSEAEIQQILDVLVFDDKIEAVQSGYTKDDQPRYVYRAQRHSLMDEADMGSVAAEVPCGRCPVFNLCEEGGPVAPSNCKYFEEWLLSI